MDINTINLYMENPSIRSEVEAKLEAFDNENLNTQKEISRNLIIYTTTGEAALFETTRDLCVAEENILELEEENTNLKNELKTYKNKFGEVNVDSVNSFALRTYNREDRINKKIQERLLKIGKRMQQARTAM